LTPLTHPRIASFIVWLITPVGYPHAGALTELAVAVDHGLSKLGHDSNLCKSPVLPALAPGQLCIVVGPHLLAMLDPLDLPEDVILYNTEAYGTPPFANALPHLLTHPDRVWDISTHNIDQLRTHHGIGAHFLPPGHDVHSFDACGEEKDIDVLFYGSINDRRRHTLDALRAEGLNVHEFQTPYGKGRDEFIRRAKVVLNLHYYADPGIFESVRVSHLLNNSELVISELGVGQWPYDQAAVCVPYDDLVPVCREYVRKGAELRISRARLGPIVMRQFLDTPPLLTSALDAVSKPSPPIAPAPSPAPPTLCLVVLGKDTDAFAAMDFHERAWREADELVLIKTKDARFGGLSEIANRIARRTRCDVVGLVHADTTFEQGSLSKFAAVAHAGNVTGMVGITLEREYVWSRDVPDGTVRRVSTLDGCSVFFPTKYVTAAGGGGDTSKHEAAATSDDPGTFWTIHWPVEPSFTFDEQFASFHCGVEDFCLSAQARGVPVVVPSTRADHHSGARGTYLQPEWQAAYWKDRKVLTDKWPTVRFETT
jgi:hypothetical protein